MSPVSSLRRPLQEHPPQPRPQPGRREELRFDLPEGLGINKRQRVCRAAMQAALCHGSLVESGARSFVLFLDDRSLPAEQARAEVAAAVRRLLADFEREDAEWAEWLERHPGWLCPSPSADCAEASSLPPRSSHSRRSSEGAKTDGILPS